ncbi:MAG: phosphatase PAP2 family protein [Bacteroidales bacterium]|nr:phosphatase PAP2 family protein [Bacteroidales bacterium]
MQKRFVGYLVTCLLLLTVSGVLLCVVPKGELHVMLNAHHTPFWDTFFRYYTKLAEWPLYLIAIIPVFFAKRRWWTYFYAACEGCNALLTTLLKNCFNMPRPVRFFGDSFAETVPIVEGVRQHAWHSFPSGHTCTFFIFFTVVALLRAYYWYTPNQHAKMRVCLFELISVVLVLLAAVGAYSRIYLSQHFLLDCFVGGLMGVSIPCMVYWFFMRRGWIPQKEME